MPLDALLHLWHRSCFLLPQGPPIGFQYMRTALALSTDQLLRVCFAP